MWIANTTSLNYNDMDILVGNTYTYAVSANSAVGDSGLSLSVTVVIPTTTTSSTIPSTSSSTQTTSDTSSSSVSTDSPAAFLPINYLFSIFGFIALIVVFKTRKSLNLFEQY